MSSEGPAPDQREKAPASAPAAPAELPSKAAAPTPPKQPDVPASRDRRAWARLGIFTIVALAFDLISKAIAFRTVAGRPVDVDREQVLAAWSQGRSLGVLIPDHPPVTIIPSVLEFTLVLNPGAVFGMGAGMRWFFICFTIAALGLAMWMFATWTKAKDWYAHLAIALLTAGGIGNLYDRIVYASVRDFIHPLPGVTFRGREIWPYVSNVADLWLIIGIIILMWYLWRTGDEKPKRSGPNA